MMAISGLNQRVSNSSLVFLRVSLGIILQIIALRYFFNGWIDELFVDPRYHFSYFGFEWWKALGYWGMRIVFCLIFLVALLFTLGKASRANAFILFSLFTYIEFIDKATYLNHYLLISILLFLFTILPIKNTVSKSVVYIFRAQIALVYIFAGIAKCKSEWLLENNPIRIWFQDVVSSLPLLSQFPVQSFAVISWSAMLFDLSIPFFLLNRRTRHYAFFTLALFHYFTFQFFNIGVFPLLMTAMATVFFAPSWFESISDKFKTRHDSFFLPKKWPTLVASCFLLLQTSLYSRHLLVDGNVLWHEKGFNFSWHVMVMEKSGYLRFRIVDPDSQNSFYLYPEDYLSPLQVKMVRTSPDMILQFAKFLKSKHTPHSEIYAESYVSLNGNEARPFVNPNLNLAKYNGSRELLQKQRSSPLFNKHEGLKTTFRRN